MQVEYHDDARTQRLILNKMTRISTHSFTRWDSTPPTHEVMAIVCFGTWNLHVHTRMLMKVLCLISCMEIQNITHKFGKKRVTNWNSIQTCMQASWRLAVLMNSMCVRCECLGPTVVTWNYRRLRT